MKAHGAQLCKPKQPQKNKYLFVNKVNNTDTGFQFKTIVFVHLYMKTKIINLDYVLIIDTGLSL